MERFDEVLGSRLAAAISYYGFFAAFALAVVVYSILGRALGTCPARRLRRHDQRLPVPAT